MTHILFLVQTVWRWRATTTTPPPPSPPPCRLNDPHDKAITHPHPGLTSQRKPRPDNLFSCKTIQKDFSFEKRIKRAEKSDGGKKRKINLSGFQSLAFPPPQADIPLNDFIHRE